ncbi:hypothetical protein HPB48_008524 [Haemaphysalis longicornis]|uniref:Methyltransferase type 11 domain-containing protein n=1 Tax=Haemaphysalis longicornis TaxID=44386 RepID=A0A9J6H423_HAELO|nr:hypothetical protein HPB48_008524 [Haemaphysalis longicornis]
MYTVGVALGVALFLPLSLSRWFRQFFYVRLYTAIQSVIEESLLPVRAEVMAYLDDMTSHDADLRSTGLLRVLEIGAGWGANFCFVKRNIEYWNVDPNKEFNHCFRRQLCKYPKVQMKGHVCGCAEDMKELPDEHFDVVIMTFVLCSAGNGAKVLEEIKRVLVKGGRLLFAEHVAHPRGSPARWLQNFSTFVSSPVSCGCRQNRETWLLYERAGFSKLEMKEANLDIPYAFNRICYGIAEV